MDRDLDRRGINLVARQRWVIACFSCEDTLNKYSPMQRIVHFNIHQAVALKLDFLGLT